MCACACVCVCVCMHHVGVVGHSNVVSGEGHRELKSSMMCCSEHLEGGGD